MEKQLYKTYENYLKIGAAVNRIFYSEDNDFKETKIVSRHFNLVVAENDTKMCNVFPRPGEYDFSQSDKFIAFAKKNNQLIRWHTLVWHNQSPNWIFEDQDGNKVSKEVLEQRLYDYIMTVGKRYSKDVCSVDVVNECISDKNFCLRNGKERSKWYDIIGPEYIDKAFIWAKKAFPNSHLVINDYNLESIIEKRNGMFNLLKGMLERGIPVDTVGLQMHINMDYPSVNQIEETIEMFGSLGLNVIVTEMEVSVYHDYDKNGKENFQQRKDYDSELLEKQAQRYKEIFDCFKKEAEKGILKDVVLWGISDKYSWKNDFPVPGRTDAPLLFDAAGNPKPAFYKLCE